MSRASSSQSPDASARPARLTPSGPGNISGNSVSTVTRQGGEVVIGSQFLSSRTSGAQIRDPITTADRFAMAGAISLAKNCGPWLWVPAFAGTTRREVFVLVPVALNLLRQRDNDATALEID